MLTKEEKQALEMEIAGARQHCYECWQTLLQLNALTKSYLQIHEHWRKRYEKADRKLAEAERLTILPPHVKGTNPRARKLTKADILAIAKELDADTDD